MFLCCLPRQMSSVRSAASVTNNHARRRFSSVVPFAAVFGCRLCCRRGGNSSAQARSHRSSALFRKAFRFGAVRCAGVLAEQVEVSCTLLRLLVPTHARCSVILVRVPHVLPSWPSRVNAGRQKRASNAEAAA